MKKNILFLFCCLQTIFQIYCMETKPLVEQSIIKEDAQSISFNKWSANCKCLPTLKETRKFTKGITFNEFEKTLDKFLDQTQTNYSLNQDRWLPDNEMPQDFENLHSSNFFAHYPFVQKRIVEPDSVIAFKGDLHGDVHSLIKYIEYIQTLGFMNDFKITDPNFYLVFLGDYTDAGLYGVEVIYTLMRLKLENPEQVLLIRGNHEDIVVTSNFEFIQEFKCKFSNELNEKKLSEKFKKLHKMYDLLPSAIFLGCGSMPTNYIQCCHGGMEIGFDAKNLLATDKPIAYQWISQLNKTTGISKLNGYYNDIYPMDIQYSVAYPPRLGQVGFMWSDFIVDPNNDKMQKSSSRGGCVYEFGKTPTKILLDSISTEQNIVRAVFRGHQHASAWTDMMKCILDPENRYPDSKGVGKIWRDENSSSNNLWPGIVCTFCVAPNTIYGTAINEFPGFDEDYCGLLSMRESFEDWHLQVI